MSKPAAEILEEIDACIARIAAFQEGCGRRVFQKIKRSRKGRAGMAVLAGFGLPVPEDFAALYYHYNGIGAVRLSFWEQSVFLDASWPDSGLLWSFNEIARIEKHFHAERKIRAFHTTRSVSYDLFPDLAQDGAVPLVANRPLSRRTFIAFDSTLALLRSVCAAQEAGILRYAPERMAHFASYSCDVEAGEILFDPKELWNVIRPFNARAEYWPLLAQGPVDWQEIPYELPKDGRLQLDPKVRAIILGQIKPPKPQPEP
jgi:hypothetical protein